MSNATGSQAERPLGRQFRDVDGQVSIGRYRRLAYALAIWPHQEMPRPVLRAMIPESGKKRYTAQRYHHLIQKRGVAPSGKNRTSENVLEALRRFELAGLVKRGERYILILDREELLGRALRGVDGERVEFLAIEAAVAPAREAVAEAKAERARQIALRDLQAVYDLMKNDAGVWHGGKSNVRHVPHGWRGRPS